VPDETEHEGQASSTPHMKRENKADPVVKIEEGNEHIPGKKTCQSHKRPSNELHIYSAAKLSRLNQ